MVHHKSYKEIDSPNVDHHKGFQFGGNPMAMTPFEQACVAKEVHERTKAREVYVQGIQGRDGGCLYPTKPYYKAHDDYESDPLY